MCLAWPIHPSLATRKPGPWPWDRRLPALPRIATGREALINSALKGKGVMPPKAGNPKLTDEEVIAALDHMVAAAK